MTVGFPGRASDQLGLELGIETPGTIAVTLARNIYPDSVVGQRFVHHHIENGSLVVTMPESLYLRLNGVIHATPMVVRTPQ